MGIYAEHTYDRQTSARRAPAVLHTIHVPGLDQVFVYELVAVIENRTNCFCCSCPPDYGVDAACRNHGWAAERPCEEHGMPGQPWDVDDGSDAEVMPESVQEVRRLRAENERALGLRQES